MLSTLSHSASHLSTRQGGTRLAAIALMFAATFVAPAASAETLTERLKAPDQAAMEFTLQLAMASGPDAARSLSNEQNLARIRTVGGMKHLLDEASYTQAEITHLRGSCESATTIVRALMMTGNAPTSAEELRSPEFLRRTQQGMAANVGRFDAQMAELMPLAQRCEVPLIKTLQNPVSNQSSEEEINARRDVVLKARAEFAQAYESGLIVLESAAAGEQLRQSMATALEETASRYAPALDLAKRRSIAKRIREMTERAKPGARDGLGRMAEAFEITSCTGLCTY